MIYIIHSREAVTDALCSQLLADMTQMAAGIDDSSQFLFDCIFSSANLVAYELPDTPFTPKLRGVALMQLGPNGAMDDLTAYRVWKTRGEEFAKLHVQLLQVDFNVDNLDIIDYDGMWYFHIHSPELMYTRDRVQHRKRTER